MCYKLQAQWFLYSVRASVSHRKTHRGSHLPADYDCTKLLCLSPIYSCAYLFLRHIRRVQVFLCKSCCLFNIRIIQGCVNMWIKSYSNFYFNLCKGELLQHLPRQTKIFKLLHLELGASFEAMSEKQNTDTKYIKESMYGKYISVFSVGFMTCKLTTFSR